MKLKLVLACALGVFAANAMACYQVFDKSNRIVYQGANPPVDMSLPLHTTLQRAYPGGSMIFDQTSSCTDIALPQREPVRMTVTMREPAPSHASNTAVMGAGPATRQPRRTRTVTVELPSSPLFTDLDTAQAMGLPHRQLGNGIVVVSPNL